MTAPLSVACVHVSSALGGAERVLADFAARAPRHGIAAHIILPTDGPLVEVLREAGVAVSVVPAPEGFLAASQRTRPTAGMLARFGSGLWRWSRAIRAELAALERGPHGRPAVLYSGGFKAHLACALIRGYPRVWHVHEFPPPYYGPIWRAGALAFPTAVIVPSTAVARAWRGLAGPEPIVVVNGVDLDRFQPAERTFWIHDRLHIAHDARLIGMPAVFARSKGQLLVVEAFERAAGRLGDAHLVLVGGHVYDTVADRGYTEELAQRVRRSPLAGRIHLLEFQRDPWRLYPEFDLVVSFSTRPEGFGRVAVEAMACGTPTIAAGAGGPVEIIEDGVSGWLSTPGDVPILARAIETAAASDLRGVGAAARARAEVLFSADRFAAELAQALRAAVS